MNSKDNVRNRIIRAQGSENSAVLFVAGDNKMKDHANRTNIFGRARMLFMALLMVLTMTATAMSGTDAYAANDTVYVATYDQLRVALEDTPGVKEVVVDPQAAVEEGEVVYSVEGDEESNAFYIGFDGPLTVSHDITITSADDVDVYFARSDSFRRDQGKPALLNVDSTGNLNLDGLITMTSEEVTTTFYEADEENPAEFVFSVKSKDGTGEDNEAWDRGQALKGGFYIQNNGGEYTLGDDVIMEDINLADDVEGVEQIHEVEKTTLRSLFSSNKNEEEATVEESAESTESTEAEENTVEEPVVAPAPKRMMKNALMGSTPTRGGDEGTDYTPNDQPGTRTVATYAQLVAALKEEDINTIIIDKTGVLSDTNNKDKDGNKQAPKITGNGESGVFYLPIDAPLTVNRAVEIKTKDANTEVIIARSEKFKNNLSTDNNSALFNVTSSGDLTLSSKITMTGDQVTATYNAGQGYEAPVVKPIEIKFDGVYLDATNSGNVFNITLSTTSGVKFWIEGDGHLACTNPVTKKTNYLRAESKTTYSLKESKDETNDVRVIDENGNYVKTLEAGKTYRLINGLWTNAKKEPYYVIKDGNNLDTTTDANDSRIISFSVPATDENSNEIISAGKDYIEPSFKFEVTERLNTNGIIGSHWKAGEVKAGGFFVNVNAGKLTINEGVTLRKLHCGPYVSNVAPIVVRGDESSSKADDGKKNFVMNGGSIEGNKIGYKGDFLDSTNNVITIANALKGDDGTGTKGDDNKMTNTAGGVIFTDKATAAIAGGSINGNKADAGGIIVTEEAYVKFTSGQINSNIGVHHAGAAQVEHGGTLVMDGANAEMKNNIAWYKGGAVWATEWGTSGYAVADWRKWPKEFPTLTDASTRSDKGGGNFVLKNGTIQNNTAFARAGAIEVESNGVQLDGGLIDSNYCRSLGGAIYIEGDSPNYSYSLVLPKGYITNNTAVFKTPRTGNDYTDENALLDRKIGDSLNTETGSWLVSNSNPGDNSDGDFNGALGNGGGIWLCPVGGTSVFTGGDIYIWDNDAERNKGGEDFYLHRGNGAAMLQSVNLQGDWINEVTGASVDKNLGTVSGPLSMTNNTTDYTTGTNGVVITNNIARDGGAIACNGTFIIGKAQNVHRYNARIDMEKTWAEGTQPNGKTINLKLQYKSKDGSYKDLKYVAANAELDSEGNPKESNYEVDLDGSGSQIGPSDVISETTSEGGKWTASAFLPLYVMEGNTKTFLYTLKNPDRTGDIKDEVLDLSNDEHVGHLYSYIEKSDGTASLEVKDWNLQIVESIKVGNKTYKCDITYPKTGAGSGRAETITLSNPADGKTIDEFQITYSTMTFGASLTNSLNVIDIDLNKTDNYGKGISGVKFVLCEAGQDPNSDDYRFAGDENAWSWDKSDDHGKTYNDDSVKVATAVSSGNSGAIKFTGIKPGKTYFLFEDSNPDSSKYKNHTAPWLIKITESGDYTVHAIDDAHKNKVKYHNEGEQEYNDKKVWHRYWNKGWFSSTNSTTLKNDWKPISYELSKKGWNNKCLYGAKFKLYKAVDSEDTKKTNWVPTGDPTEYTVTDRQYGKFTINDLEPNSTYMLFETLAPTGYKKAVDPWFIFVDANGSVRVETMKDAYKNKHWNRNTPSVNQVASPEGTDHTVNLVGSGKEWPKDWITTNNSVGRDIANVPAEIKIKKTKKDGSSPLAGAKFAFSDLGVKDDQLYCGGSDALVKNGNNTLVITTGSNGEINLTDVIKSLNENSNGFTGAGRSLDNSQINVLMYEVKAGSNHKHKTVPWIVTIKNDGTVIIKEHKDPYKFTASPVSESGTWQHTSTSLYLNEEDFKEVSTSTISSDAVVKNEPVNIEITKVNSMDANKPVVGAKFVLNKVGDGQDYFVAGTRGNSQDNQSNKNILATDSSLKVTVDGKTTFETNNQGKISFTAPEPGKYFLFEYDVPDGYNLAKSPWLIEVSENYDVTVKAIIPSQYGKYTTGSTQSNFKDRDPLLVYNTWWTKSWYDRSQSNTTITNEPVTIKKVGENNQPLSGAIFSIWTVNYDATGVGAIQRSQNLNETYGENAFVSDANGNIDISALYNHLTLEDDNDYTRFLLYEVSAPEGYKRPKAPWMIIIDETDLYDVTLWANGKPNTDFGSNWIPYNNYCNYTTVIRNTKDPNALYKKDAESLDTLLNGAKFDLYAATKKQNCYWTTGRRSKYICEDILDDGKHIVTRGDLIKGGIESGKDTDKGKINLSDLILPDGYLLLYETDAPDGYIKESTPWILVVNNNKITDIQKCKIPYQEPYVNHNASTEWKLKDFETTGVSTYVTNQQVYNLPSAGGIGTYWFMIIGAMMMGFALTAGFTKMNLLKLLRR